MPDYNWLAAKITNEDLRYSVFDFENRLLFNCYNNPDKQ